MKKRNSVFALFLTVLLLLSVVPVEVSANSPPPSPYYVFYIEDAPEETVYVDLLICLPETDPQYQELVSGNMPEGFSADAQIVAYCEDDFRSYTFHYRGAMSMIELDRDNSVTFFTNGSMIYDDSAAYEHQEDIESRGKIRLAMLDAQGNILQISDTLSIRPTGLFSYSLGTFHYNASRDELIVDSHSNALLVVVFAIIGVIGIALTCFVECLVALCFDGVKEYRKQVIWTNVVSQLLMRISQILLLWLLGILGIGIAHIWTVLLLEVVVYLCEYLVYCKILHGVSRERCLAFTICANTASALSGLLILVVLL